MNEIPNVPKKKRFFLKLFSIIGVLLLVAGFFLYTNFNRLLSEALLKSFSKNIVSDVYELKFEKLNVNFLTGNISVINVVMQPREIPLNEYPYINSSFILKTQKIKLTNVKLLALIKLNKLELEKIEIIEPDIYLNLSGKKYILFPFIEKTAEAAKDKKTTKRPIESYFLKEFNLANATFHVINTTKEREFKINNFNISLNDLLINQKPGEDQLSYNSIEVSLGDFTGDMGIGGIKHISFKDFKINIDSLNVQKTKDTTIFHFTDVRAAINALDIQTADSIFHLAMQSFNLSYKEKSLKLGHFVYEPNVSNAVLQKKFKFQHTEFSGKAAAINLININFDSLIYYKKIYIDEITIDSAEASIFKDNSKPVDPKHLPIYFGQQILKIPLTIAIKKVTATNANLVNVERKPDGNYAKANVRRAKVTVTNITNLPTKHPLTLNASAYLENKVHVNLKLGFSYQQPQFTIAGKFEKFNLPDLNPIIKGYTPASVYKGIVDEISFTGTVFSNRSEGEMKFLYHDLDMSLELHNQAKWKSDVLAFAANTALNSSNPAVEGQLPRIVKFHAERNMNKGFINILIKSVLSGLKETMIMSKENKKAHKQELKEQKKIDKKKAKLK